MPVPERPPDDERLAALRRTAALDAPLEPGFEALVRAVALGVEAPTALLALVDGDRQLLVASHGLPEPWRSRHEAPPPHAVAASAQAPLLTETGQVLGSLYAIDGRPRAWSERDLEFLRAMAASAMATVAARTDSRLRSEARDRADAVLEADRELERMIQHERQARSDERHRLAAELQRGLLPSRIDHPGLTTLYEPGERRMLVGGDFLDYHERPDGSLALLIGDVSGHGSTAAAFAVGLRVAWRALVVAGVGPYAILARLNDVARSERPDDEMFATVCCCDVGQAGDALTWSSAGHPPPLLVDDGARPLVGASGPPLAAVPGAEWPVHAAELGPQTAILLFTDGIVEGRAAPGSSERFGLEAFAAEVDRVAANGPLDDAGLRAVVGAARRAHGSSLPDDVALLVAAPWAVRAREAPEGRLAGAGR